MEQRARPKARIDSSEKSILETNDFELTEKLMFKVGLDKVPWLLFINSSFSGFGEGNTAGGKNW